MKFQFYSNNNIEQKVLVNNRLFVGSIGGLHGLLPLALSHMPTDDMQLSQKAVSAYLASKQMLSLGCVEQNR